MLTSCCARLLSVLYNQIMSIRQATETEITNWNSLLTANPDGGNLFQMSQSAAVKQSAGWKPRYIMAGDVAVLALERQIPLLGKFWYLPKGPSVNSVEQLAALLPDLRAFAKTQKVFTVKIETEIIKTAEATSQLLTSGLQPSFPVQPNSSTVLVDLSPALDDVLMAFNQKGRHALRRAERDGVTVEAVETNQQNIDTMYDLMAETAKGQWSLRPKPYMIKYWQSFTSTSNGQLFFASYQGQVVAASFAIAIGKNGTYKDGASIRKRTAYGASHLLQWHMMQWMKSKGVTRYDLCGVPPSDKLDDTNHYLHGVGKFKTSFNKQVIDFIGAYELPISPLRFKLWKSIVERLVLRLHRARTHQEWY